jgi:hypothetical protein
MATWTVRRTLTVITHCNTANATVLADDPHDVTAVSDELVTIRAHVERAHYDIVPGRPDARGQAGRGVGPGAGEWGGE